MSRYRALATALCCLCAPAASAAVPASAGDPPGNLVRLERREVGLGRSSWHGGRDALSAAAVVAGFTLGLLPRAQLRRRDHD